MEVRKVEDDAEKGTMSYFHYKSQKPKNGEMLTSGDRDRIAGEVAGNAEPELKSCLQSQLILTFWDSLESVAGGQRFLNTKYFSPKWCLRTIHSPGGGVS